MRYFAFILFLVCSSRANALQASETTLPQPLEQTALSTQSSSASSNAEMVSIAIIPSKTPVYFTLDTTISSRTSLSGEQFQLKVAEDVVINGKVVIPRGTPATGEVIHAQKSSVFGKAGELLLVIRYIDFHGIKIKMRSFQPHQGKDATKAALGSSFFIGPFAAFIRGGEIEVPADTMVQALVAAETRIDLQLSRATDINSLPSVPTTSPIVDINTKSPISATQPTGDSQ